MFYHLHYLLLTCYHRIGTSLSRSSKQIKSVSHDSHSQGKAHVEGKKYWLQSDTDSPITAWQDKSTSDDKEVGDMRFESKTVVVQTISQTFTVDVHVGATVAELKNAIRAAMPFSTGHKMTLAVEADILQDSDLAPDMVAMFLTTYVKWYRVDHEQDDDHLQIIEVDGTSWKMSGTAPASFWRYRFNTICGEVISMTEDRLEVIVTSQKHYTSAIKMHDQLSFDRFPDGRLYGPLGWDPESFVLEPPHPSFAKLNP